MTSPSSERDIDAEEWRATPRRNHVFLGDAPWKGTHYPGPFTLCGQVANDNYLVIPAPADRDRAKDCKSCLSIWANNRRREAWHGPGPVPMANPRQLPRLWKSDLFPFMRGDCAARNREGYQCSFRARRLVTARHVELLGQEAQPLLGIGFCFAHHPFANNSTFDNE